MNDNRDSLKSAEFYIHVAMLNNGTTKCGIGRGWRNMNTETNQMRRNICDKFGAAFYVVCSTVHINAFFAWLQREALEIHKLRQNSFNQASGIQI